MLSDGANTTIDDLKVGTKVRFAEAQPADNDQVTWGEPVFVSNADITITQENPHVSVQLKNQADDTFGTFKLSKKLSGPDERNSNIPDTFTVRATWTEANGQPQSKDLQVSKSGEIGFGEDLKNSTVVTLAEISPENGNGLAWGVSAWSGDVTVGENSTGEVVIGKQVQNVSRRTSSVRTMTPCVLSGLSKAKLKKLCELTSSSPSRQPGSLVPSSTQRL